MKLIYPAILLVLLVLIGLTIIFHMKLKGLEERLDGLPTARDINDKMDEIQKVNSAIKQDFIKIYNDLNSRIEALEAGVAEKQPQGPKSPEFVLAELERQIHLKRDARYDPDEEELADKKIKTAITELVEMQQQEMDVVGPLMERTRASRDPDFRAALIRDTAWRLGPPAVPGLMDLFRDKEFTSNLRVLAAVSALKAGGDENELLEEFSRHLNDPEEYLTIKTGLVSYIFKQRLFAGAIDAIITGARNPDFPLSHRTECLLAMSLYDHPKVLNALEAILTSPEESAWVVNHSIQAYHKILREKAVPLLEKLLNEGKVDPENSQKIKNILTKYEPEEPE
ncbi:MAG: hypothetical protein ACYTG7_01595 [Planctomycetota bacterium]|jgi:hypothetical protein